jgi:hypothetical protein
MKPIYSLVVLLTLPFSSLFATTYYSTGNGAWASGKTWSTIRCGGKSCGHIPGIGDSVIIAAGSTVTLSDNLTLGGAGLPKSLTIQENGNLNLDGKTITITSGTALYLYGTLSADSVTIAQGANMEVYGTGAIITDKFFLNNSNITVNGTITFSGSFINNTGASISGHGNMFASGSYVNKGKVFGVSAGTAENAMLEATIDANAAAKAKANTEHNSKMVAGL